jgi:hypothetical protein
MDDPQSYLRIKKAAEFLGVTETTLRHWERGGEIVSHRHPIYRYGLYKRADLEALLQKHGGDMPSSQHGLVWQVIWEDSGYPYTTLPGDLALRLDSDTAEPWSNEELELLLGWFARYPLPWLSAGEIASRFLPAISPERLREHLTTHPAFMTLPSLRPTGSHRIQVPPAGRKRLSGDPAAPARRDVYARSGVHPALL